LAPGLEHVTAPPARRTGESSPWPP